MQRTMTAFTLYRPVAPGGYRGFPAISGVMFIIGPLPR
jgi:hypothetical protein